MSAAEFFGHQIDFGDCQPLRMEDSSTVGPLIPNAIRPNVQGDVITAPLVEFKAAHVGLGKSELIIKYLMDTPGSLPNSRKMPVYLIWIFFTCHSECDSEIIYLRDKGWYVYDKMRKPQGDEMIDLVVILQTEFPT